MYYQDEINSLKEEVERLKNQLKEVRLEKTKWIFFATHTWDYELLTRLAQCECGDDFDAKINKVIEILNRVQDSMHPKYIMDVIVEKGKFESMSDGTAYETETNMFSYLAINEAIVEYKEKHIFEPYTKSTTI